MAVTNFWYFLLRADLVDWSSDLYYTASDSVSPQVLGIFPGLEHPYCIVGCRCFDLFSFVQNILRIDVRPRNWLFVRNSIYLPFYAPGYDVLLSFPNFLPPADSEQKDQSTDEVSLYQTRNLSATTTKQCGLARSNPGQELYRIQN